MDNYNLKFRVGAKIVAYLDLICSILLWFRTILVIADTETSINTDNKLSEHAAAVTWFLWFGVAILASITFLDVWAAIQLVKATELGRDVNKAIKSSKFWRIITIISLVLNVSSNIAIVSYLFLVINILIRGALIYVVHRFIQELQIYVDVQ